ncbi:hypothetical protein Mycsm_07282 (plasmid) [Mycobacterium sp. JS623]|uniref:hypothetical protein n=1 Tax=Mycobacterium sp. JS623 TaxID=212767 RepID=UPI0002A5B5A0|nr:hypothetical protein [Mycobacterium sp. JS623]AGB27374.1 hypothetical protein Mycsm_07282 [Mycobacterium sp. JS623]
MSSHYEWGHARTGLYQLVTRESAPEQWHVPEPDSGGPVTAAHALGLFTENGDGTVLQGEPGEILDYVDLVHAYAHWELDDLIEYDTRPCALCGDQVRALSSRDWCDACEATVIPGDVWRAFLAQESLLDDEAPGPVSLSAVVGELRRMIAEHQQADGGG